MAIDPHGVGKVYKFLRDEAYGASIELAKEKYDKVIPEYGGIGKGLWKVVYMCEFRMDTAYMHVVSSSITDFKEGFWLNDNYEFTKGSDAVTWMPPSSIIRIRKEQK